MILKLLEDKGYQAISFDSGYAYTDFREVDRYFSPHRNIIKLNSFEGMLLNASMARIFIDKGLITSPYSYANHRDTVVYALDHLADTALIAGPKFVFAHIMAPHPPFILDENGQAVQSEQPYHLTFQGTREEYISGYAKEITYIDQELIAALDSILQLSSIAPVIILQADHGPGAYLNWDKYDEGCVQERMAILNAYYLPGINNNDLYKTISPVNTFRVVLNGYFDTQLKLLDDRYYFSYWGSPYDFIDITELAQQKCQLP